MNIQKNLFNKWGISWMYRFNKDHIKELFKGEPINKIYPDSQELIKKTQ